MPRGNAWSSASSNWERAASSLETLARANVVGEFAAEIVVKAALRQPGKELARQRAEAISASEPPDVALNFLRARSEQRRQCRSHHRRQAFDGRHLGHLAKISASPSISRITIDRPEKAAATSIRLGWSGT